MTQKQYGLEKNGLEVGARISLQKERKDDRAKMMQARREEAENGKTQRSNTEG